MGEKVREEWLLLRGEEQQKETKRKGRERKEITMKEKKSEVEKFFSSIVIPAFGEAKTELEKLKKDMIVYIRKEDNPTITLIAGAKEYSYTVKVRVFPSRLILIHRSRLSIEKIIGHTGAKAILGTPILIYLGTYQGRNR